MARTSRRFLVPPAELLAVLEALAAGRQSLAPARDQLRRTLAADPRQADLLVLWVERARDEGRLPLSVADALLVLAAGHASEDVPTIGAPAPVGARVTERVPDDGAEAPAGPLVPPGQAMAAAVAPEPEAVRPRAAAPPSPASRPGTDTPPQADRPASTLTRAADPAREPVASLRPGSVLKDRYVLGDRLGGGGMADIYKALDRQRERAGDPQPWVALKIATVTGEPGTAALALQREAALAGRLEHPNIVRMSGLDRDGPHLFLAMELLDGESLARRLDQRRQRPLARLHALPLIEGLCRGLGHLHGAGIVHGDIKPGNVFVTLDERVKLIDFGVARDLRSPGPATPPGHTVEYASCEVLAGAPPEPADDIFAAACVAYRLLAGQRPFGNRTALEAEAAGLRPAPIDSLAASQWQALDQALAFRRAGRPADVGEFLAAFKGLRDEPGPAMPPAARPPAPRQEAEQPGPAGTRRRPPSPRPRRWRFPGTWAAFVAVCGVGAALALWAPGRLDPVVGAPAPAGQDSETPAPATGATSPAELPEPAAADAAPPPADPSG